MVKIKKIVAAYASFHFHNAVLTNRGLKRIFKMTEESIHIKIYILVFGYISHFFANLIRKKIISLLKRVIYCVIFSYAMVDFFFHLSIKGVRGN